MPENKIHLLPPHLINQIAAGEVVERPASVVKELVENSIDAGAKNIRIEIENGGLNLIKVIDDGCGMSRADAEQSILQHATSKILEDADLEKISTLGFRGEALASISSVSDFSLLTKDADSLAGTLLEMQSTGVQLSESSAAKGTVISVRNLFQKIPARKKYLKTTVTEFNHIVDLFFEFCLAYPNIFWKLVHNNKTVYQFPIATLLQRIGDVLGDEIAKNLIEIDIKLIDIHVHGYIGKPQIARNNRKLQYLCINNRPVHEFIVAKQVKDAFGTLLPRDLYPVYILNLQIDTDKVDVNVHPRKWFIAPSIR
jgi:DNA mismatch repair protein MutL